MLPIIITLIYVKRAALKVILPLLLCWPTESEVDVGSMVEEVELSHHEGLLLCDRWQ